MSDLCTLKFTRRPTNERRTIVIVPIFDATDPRAALTPSAKGSRGVYEATFVLAVPGSETYRIGVSATQLLESGDSLLLSKARLRVDTTNGATIDLIPNGRGALARAVIRVQADNFREAELQACDIVLPMLSALSFTHDVAIDVAGRHLREEATDAFVLECGFVGDDKPFFGIVPLSRPEHRELFSAYREAISGINALYQALCYYKVVEGVKRIRKAQAAAALAAGRVPQGSIEVFPALAPADPYLSESFKPYLGMKFTRVLDQFRTLIRNTVAHLDPFANSLSADRYQDSQRCQEALPVLKHIAREMLRNELRRDPETANCHVA